MNPKDKVFGNVIKHLESIKWYYGMDNRGSGRTSSSIISVLLSVLSDKHSTVFEVLDHVGRPEQVHYLKNKVHEVFSLFGIDYNLITKPSRMLEIHIKNIPENLKRDKILIGHTKVPIDFLLNEKNLKVLSFQEKVRELIDSGFSVEDINSFVNEVCVYDVLNG